MTTTYPKGLPRNAELESFLWNYSEVFHKAACKTVDHLLEMQDSSSKFNKSGWNTSLQKEFSINKRHANSVISFADGCVKSAIESRKLHIEILEGMLKSAEEWIKKHTKKLEDAVIFYKGTKKKIWTDSKKNCPLPQSCELSTKRTNWWRKKFNIHQKKRYVGNLKRKIAQLKTSKDIKVSVPRDQCFFVGSKTETLGNQIAQWDGQNIKIRVPQCLEKIHGKYIDVFIGGFKRKNSRIPVSGSRTWHFFYKNEQWVAGLQFIPEEVPTVSRHSKYGCIGIDLNPGSIGWAYSDSEGNLKAHGKIPLQQGLSKGQMQAQLVDASLQLRVLGETFACPFSVEKLDFAQKKKRMRDQGTKYNRMLSSWAYNKFFEIFGSICSNAGINIFQVNPAYTSQIALLKYCKQYGLGSDEAAGFVVARRLQRLTERIPSKLRKKFGVPVGKHVWSGWSRLSKAIKKSEQVNRRHDYYSTSDWSFLK